MKEDERGSMVPLLLHLLDGKIYDLRGKKKGGKWRQPQKKVKIRRRKEERERGRRKKSRNSTALASSSDL